MPSLEYLRDFVNERLTAAVEEIFGVFEVTIVKYAEEIDRQRRLLDIVLKPGLKLHRIELPQQHVCTEEEVFAEQQLQERNFSLDQEDPEPPQIKEEQEEQLVTLLKQETDTFMLTPAHEGSDHQTLYCNPDQSQSEAEAQPPANICITLLQNESEHLEVSEPKSAHRNSQVAESMDHKGDKHGDPVSTRNTKPQKTRHKIKSHTNDVHNPNSFKTQSNTHTAKASLKCGTCGVTFKYKSQLQGHLSVHTGERPFSCSTCGKRFRKKSLLNSHLRIHSGAKPFSCATCEKDFTCRSSLLLHMRTHTGEMPYSCETCGNSFRWRSCFTLHMRTHTGERPYTCQTCGKDFRSSSNLKNHMRTHTHLARTEGWKVAV